MSNDKKVILEVRNLEKHFYIGKGKSKIINPAVDNISFDVFENEVFGIVGESGSGKTTAGRTIMKLYNPTNGITNLDGIPIGAGFRGNLAEIKRLQREKTRRIRKLDSYKTEVHELTSKNNKAIKLIDKDIEIKNAELVKTIRDINLPITNYKEKVYELTNELKVDLDRVTFDIDSRRKVVVESGKNHSEQTYLREKAIETNIFKQKVSALNESAALTKEQINLEITAITEDHKIKIENLEKEYAPLIEKDNEFIVDKEIVKTQLQELKEELKSEHLVLKNAFKDSVNSLDKPDYATIKVSISEAKAANKEEINKLKEIKKQTMLEFKAEKAGIVVQEKTAEEKLAIKEGIAEITAEIDAKILEEKKKIAVAKEINKSKEAIAHSRNIQMIFQDPISSLNPRMTVKEIVAEGLVIQGLLNEEEISEKVYEALELVGLSPEYSTRYPHEFSGGQRQRIGIARALIMEPKFIIADEPISALDVSIRAQVLNLLTDLKDRLGLTILFVAHDLSVVRFFCDRIAVMFAGKIVELASSEELFTNPMHDYTKSLLSAIPQPDPDYEKGRKRTEYNPFLHDYSTDKPVMREIAPGHQVYANDFEFEQMKKAYNNGGKGN